MRTICDTGFAGLYVFKAVVTLIKPLGYLAIAAGATITWCLPPFGFACGVPLILTGTTIVLFF